MNVGKPVGFKYMSDGRTDGRTDRQADTRPMFDVYPYSTRYDTIRDAILTCARKPT